jgi:pyruvate-formate lyase-activating enzyme
MRPPVLLANDISPYQKPRPRFGASRSVLEERHTALDTTGFLGNRLCDTELKQIDLVLLDIKMWDPERHRHLKGSRGQRHARPLANVALEAGKPSWMRRHNRRGG